ncbi:hypothetical protein [Novosphingobium sp.]|uniref:hypothetical protein n=1 Tax=Novosphingobium sp. TaxID=1874826 RepID=UPI002639EC2B|nr:hypothetical protein [Novosphingobium sp.]
MSAVIKSPATPVRSWAILRHDSGGWIGMLIGGRDPADEGPDRTDVGPYKLVRQALLRREVRQGLPIIICADLPPMGSTAA